MGLSSGGLPSGGPPLGSVSIQKFVQLSGCTGNFYLDKNAFQAAEKNQGVVNRHLITQYLDTQTLQRSPQDHFFTVQQTPVSPSSLNQLTQFLSTSLKPLQVLLQNLGQQFPLLSVFQRLVPQQQPVHAAQMARLASYMEPLMASLATFFFGNRKEAKNNAVEEERRQRDLDDALFAQQDGGLLAIQAPASSGSAGGNAEGSSN